MTFKKLLNSPDVIITYGILKGIMESAACYKSLKILKSIIEAVQNTTYNTKLY